MRAFDKSRFGSNVMDSTDSPFVTEFDAVPGFWNYLLGLDRNDLIAELIQNDLDQGATCTTISFEKTRLVCDGNGAPVEPEGWQRLRKTLGAGDEVTAKRRRFGVKNHGLKTAFTIADEISLMSDGKAIVQTLYAMGRNMPPRPGASRYPMEDRQAPVDGCRVVVHYRHAALKPSQGEAIKLDAVGMEELDGLFRSACASVPEQFAGIVSPEITPRYEIVLQHWRLGEARFVFTCTQPRKISIRMEFFRRRCSVSGTFTPLPQDLREQAFRRLVPLRGVLKDRTADFFCRGRHFFVEVSWPIDAKGKPKTGTGKFRYPIGYPPGSHEARTGHSTYFNAPFASDKERHAPARNEATNSDLREACESLLIDALAKHAIPRWAAEGLNPVVPSSDADDGDEIVRALLAKLVQSGALPILSWRNAAELAAKGKKKRVEVLARELGVRRSSKEMRRYRFVLPILTWKADALHTALCLLCPRSERQLDPRIPGDIIRLLADSNTPGFGEDFITFDENDVFDCVSPEGNEYFDGIADPEREFAEPFFARTYLDVIKLALDKGKLKAEKEEKLISALLLPDDNGQAMSFRDLYSNASLPTSIPGLHLPPILNPDLVPHALFRRKGWRLRNFTIAEFLEGGALQAAGDQTRRMFWKWLCRNGRHIAPRDRPKLADLIIWPDENGSLCKISDLCDPRSRRVGTVLAGFIRRPHEQVRRSKLVSVGGRARTSVRRTPTEDEVAAWLDQRLARFEVGGKPDAARTGELQRLEADLAILLEDRSIAPLLKGAAVTLPALARDGLIRFRTELVLSSPGNDRLALPDRFLLEDREGAAILDKLSPALNAPTPAMILDAFAEDSVNISALQPRLNKMISVSEPDSDERRELAGMPIIPVDGQWRAPSALAFGGNKGDYWGDWKTRISTEGLSQNDQSCYHATGVNSASPDPETSRAFFGWLATQEQYVLRRHIPCVLRHILHRNGPEHWAPSFTETPSIPARSRDGLRLVSLRTAQRKSVFLSDAGDMGDAVIQKDGAVLLVIHQASEVAAPISEPLRRLGVRSLREALKEPENVAGIGDIVSVSEEILARFHELQSARFRRTFRKRLNELGVESGLVRRDWQDRLGRVREMRIAEEVEVRYRFRRKPYLLNVDAGFDTRTGIFWMKEGLGARRLYASVAKQLVFKPTARPIVFFALEGALELEIADTSFGRPAGSEADASDDDTAEENTGELGHEDEANDRLGEAGGGHSPFTPDPERNRPKPGPISNESTGRSRGSKGQSGSQGSGDDGRRQTPELEKKHIEELKHDHYASHCQMCLCEHPPGELAPVGSYIESEEVRQSVVHAHHTDLVSAGAVRHAGNLILLCKLHHDNYGRQFTRAGVTAALRDSPKQMSIRFDEASHVTGWQIAFVISGTGEIVKLFFTDHHVEYWLSQESESD